MLIDDIRKDRMVAFKAKENIKKDVLGCLIADSCKETKEPEDAKVLAMIKKFIDGANEVIEHAKDGSFEHYKATMEIDILTAYRPKQMAEPDIRALIVTIKEDISDVNLGAVMKYFKDNYLGQYDGALVSKCAKEILANG